MDKIITSKLFHNNNLKLELVYIEHVQVYIITITRINNNEQFDMFGIFETLESALQKFNSISL